MAQATRAASLFDSGRSFLGVPAQPEPILFPRKALDQRFAVLLLNSMYDAVDSLDFIPMVRPHTWRRSLCKTCGCSAKQGCF